MKIYDSRQSPTIDKIKTLFYFILPYYLRLNPFCVTNIHVFIVFNLHYTPTRFSYNKMTTPWNLTK